MVAGLALALGGSWMWAAPLHQREQGNMQIGFPFTYLFEAERWMPRRDVFLFPPDVSWPPQVWNIGCINCHATAGQPRQNPKTSVIDTRTAELGIACEACHGPAEVSGRDYNGLAASPCFKRGDQVCQRYGVELSALSARTGQFDEAFPKRASQAFRAA